MGDLSTQAPRVDSRTAQQQADDSAGLATSGAVANKRANIAYGQTNHIDPTQIDPTTGLPLIIKGTPALAQAPSLSDRAMMEVAAHQLLVSRQGSRRGSFLTGDVTLPTNPLPKSILGGAYATSVQQGTSGQGSYKP